MGNSKDGNWEYENDEETKKATGNTRPTADYAAIQAEKGYTWNPETNAFNPYAPTQAHIDREAAINRVWDADTNEWIDASVDKTPVDETPVDEAGIPKQQYQVTNPTTGEVTLFDTQEVL